jgi:hypothetical protein
MSSLPHNLLRSFVRAQAKKTRLPQFARTRPLAKCYLRDQLWLHPMDAAAWQCIGVLSCKIRSSFWNRNERPVVFRFCHAQSKNWSDSKNCTERNALLDRASMGAKMLDRRILNLVTLLMMIIPMPALSHANFVLVSRFADNRIRSVIDELDPDDTDDCFSLGELDIDFRTDNNGPPNIGVVLTDPRERRIGFDPLTKRGWDALPVAQGYIDCDDLGGADTCRGVVQVCGPVTGIYKLEVIAQQTTAYSVSVLARSREVLDGNSLQSYRSDADLENVAIGRDLETSSC